MAQYYDFCPVSDIPPGSVKSRIIEDVPVAVFNIDGTYHVILDSCPHTGGPLSEGFLEGTQITCPWHGWKFSLVTGELDLINSIHLKKLEWTLENNIIKVRLPE